MKQIILLLSLILTLGFTGCITAPDGKKRVDVQRVSRLAGDAAHIGVRFHLADHPADRAKVEAVYQAINALVEKDNYDPVAFASAFQNLIPSLQGGRGALLAEAALIAWRELAVQYQTSLDASWAKTVVVSVRDGLKRALEQSP